MNRWRSTGEAIMHTTIYFLTTANDLDDAASRIEGYLETEHFFDYYTVLKAQAGTLEEKRTELLEWQKQYDWKKAADEEYAKAEALKAEGNLSWAGYHYRKAGSLYEQLLIDDAAVYNIDSYDYTIPDENVGEVNSEPWFCIPVDFHV
jgi:hypothetical protein